MEAPTKTQVHSTHTHKAYSNAGRAVSHRSSLYTANSIFPPNREEPGLSNYRHDPHKQETASLDYTETTAVAAAHCWSSSSFTSDRTAWHSGELCRHRLLSDPFTCSKKKKDVAFTTLIKLHLTQGDGCNLRELNSTVIHLLFNNHRKFDSNHNARLTF